MAARPTALVSAASMQVPGVHGSSDTDSAHPYRHSMDVPLAQYQGRYQYPTANVRVSPLHASVASEDEVYKLRSNNMMLKEQLERLKQRSANLASADQDPHSFQQLDGVGAAAPLPPQQGSAPSQEWLRSELDRLRSEFQLKDEVATMLKTTLDGIKQKEAAAGYGQPQGMPPGSGVPVISPVGDGNATSSGMLVPSVSHPPLVGPVGGQGGQPAYASALPMPNDGIYPGNVPVASVSPSVTPVGLWGGGSPGLGSGSRGSGFPPSVPHLQPGAPHPQYINSYGSGYTFPTATLQGYGIRGPGAPIISPRRIERDSGAMRVEMEHKTKQINALLSNVSQLEMHVKLLTEALDDERRDNQELSKENSLLKAQIERLTTASEKLLKGMTSIHAA